MAGFDVAGIQKSIADKYRYRKVAASPQGLFRYPTGEAITLGLAYSAKLVWVIPPSVWERFVGMGNPFALGPIHLGESVLDLGCGAGFDSLIAGFVVGPSGRVVGIDLSADMLAVAEEGRLATGLASVRFQEAPVERLSLPDDAFDVVLSNGVLNLIPDKPGALREIFRVLRPGGRLQACDIGLAGEEAPRTKRPGRIELPGPWRGRSSSRCLRRQASWIRAVRAPGTIAPPSTRKPRSIPHESPEGIAGNPPQAIALSRVLWMLSACAG